MRAVFLPAGVGFVLSNPHWEYTLKKTPKNAHNFRLSSAAPKQMGIIN
jgi:hypothetical protein